MSKKYVDQVVDNYGKNFEKANNEIDTALNDFYITIDSILKENTFPEEQMTKWTTLLQTASVKASELKIKIDEHINAIKEMPGTERAKTEMGVYNLAIDTYEKIKIELVS